MSRKAPQSAQQVRKHYASQKHQMQQHKRPGRTYQEAGCNHTRRLSNEPLGRLVNTSWNHDGDYCFAFGNYFKY